jgi:type IV pilus assembly protein PilO
MAGLPKGQREQGLLILCVASLIAIGAYWNFVYSKTAVDIDLRQQHAATLITMNQKAKMEVAKGNVNEIRRQLAEYQQNLMLIRSLIPTGNEVPSLLEQISTAARRVGLDVATVDPQPVIEGDNYDTYRYTMSVVGGYHALAEFLANVGNLTRIVLPVNVALALPNNSATLQAHRKAGEAAIEARFQLQTFVTKTAVADPSFDAPRKRGVKS